MRIDLQRVAYMPKELKPGILYVAERFGAAAHLCACGCGTKVRTPLGPTEWALEETDAGPSLSPSVGNWQHTCQSHYWITRGDIVWGATWTPEQIASGRQLEEKRRQVYYSQRKRPSSIFGKMRAWLAQRLPTRRRKA
jgi:hypothetical protein